MEIANSIIGYSIPGSPKQLKIQKYKRGGTNKSKRSGCFIMIIKNPEVIRKHIAVKSRFVVCLSIM